MLHWMPGLHAARLLVCVAAIALFGWSVRPAHAATLLVTTSNDSGAGSLREAITTANASAGDDLIRFAASTNGTPLVLNSPLPDILDNGTLTIIGNGAAQTLINANGTGRILTVDGGATLIITALALTGGRAENNGGAINNLGTLTVEASELYDNQSATGGGALANSGTLLVRNSRIEQNSALNGGGIYSVDEGTLTVLSSVIATNTATNGGGIFQFVSDATLINSTIQTNNAATGGGLFNNLSTITLYNTIVANSASGGDCFAFESDITAQYSLMEGGDCTVTAGVNGNLIVDPQLAADSQPLPGSPVIDAGSNSLVPADLVTDLVGQSRIQGAQVDLGAYERSTGTGTSTPTATTTPTATSTPTPTTPTPTTPPSEQPLRLILPLVVGEQLLPDLVVESITLTPDIRSFQAGEPVEIQVIIRNIGNAPASAFWVDLYLNPSTPPDAANQRWNERCGMFPCYGMAWLVAGLNPGEQIVLTSAQVVAGQSIWPRSFAPGTTSLYVYADTWNPNTATGGVTERNEQNNRQALFGLQVQGVSSTAWNSRPKP